MYESIDAAIADELFDVVDCGFNVEDLVADAEGRFGSYF